MKCLENDDQYANTNNASNGFYSGEDDPQGHFLKQKLSKNHNNNDLLRASREQSLIVDEMKTINASKLYLSAQEDKCNRSVWRRYAALKRIRQVLDSQHSLHADLFALDSEVDVTENVLIPETDTFQNHWYHGSTDTQFIDIKRSSRLNQLYNDMRRQLNQIDQNKNSSPIIDSVVMKTLLKLVKARPLEAVDCFIDRDEINTAQPLSVTKRKCSINNCKMIALPLTSTCIQHVLSCKQMLFEKCHYDGCDKPIININHQQPYCTFHSLPSNHSFPDFSLPQVIFNETANSNQLGSFSNTKIYQCGILKNNHAKKNKSNPLTTNLSSYKKRLGFANNRTNNKQKVSQIRKGKQSTNASQKQSKKALVSAEKNADPFQLPKASKKDPLNMKPEKKCRKLASANNTVDLFNLNENLSSKKTHDAMENIRVHSSATSCINLNNDDHCQQMLQDDKLNNSPFLNSDDIIPNNYIQVEEIIEEVEIADEMLDPSELETQELVHCDDLNAVMKQLPPEAFNELFSEFTLPEE